MDRSIIVIGGNGQLGQCMNEVVSGNKQPYSYVFLSKADLNITSDADVADTFEKYKPLYCINCAAYTAVDLAEDESDNAFELNEFAVKRLAANCVIHNTILIHISTDFVFDGCSSIPLTETMATAPVNVYGISKLKGELEIQKSMDNFFIIRTGWLYSEKGANFVKTMLRLSRSKSQLEIIYDQIGTPTYGMDLAKVIVHIIQNNIKHYGIYNYSNEGVASWYDFAKAIFEFAEIDMQVLAIASSGFLSKAKRPHYSVLNKTKIKAKMGIEIPYWRDSLNFCIQNL